MYDGSAMYKRHETLLRQRNIWWLTVKKTWNASIGIYVSVPK